MGWLAAVLLAQANQPPTASFTTTPAVNPSTSSVSGAPPLSVTVNGSGSSDPDGTIVSYSWDWEDDGTPDASGATPATHVYSVTGTFRLRLTVTDNVGATGTASVLVDSISATNSPPIAAILSATQTASAPMTVAFRGIGHGNDSTAPHVHRWDLGDGSGFVTFSGRPNHSETTHTHVYSGSGPYVVVFRVTDTEGVWREQAMTYPPPPGGGSSGGSCGSTGAGPALALATLLFLRRRRR
jgi:PKD repeat protein